MSRSLSHRYSKSDEIICVSKSRVSNTLIIFVISSLIAMAIYLWWQFYEDSVETRSGNVTEVLFFKREGCVHCERMRGEWETFKQNNYLRKNNIRVRELDGSNEDDRKIMEQYMITGVPTIIFKRKHGHQVYNGARKANLMIDQLKQL